MFNFQHLFITEVHARTGRGESASTGRGGGGRSGGCGCTGDNNHGGNVGGWGETSGSRSTQGGSYSGGYGGGGSTPFLYVQKGGGYQMENDVMFGYPSTLRPDEATGRRLYERGKIGSDQYVIREGVEVEGDTIRMQIREIEPEESFIDSLSLEAVAIPVDHELFVSDDMSILHSFEKKAVLESKGVKEQKIRINGNTEESLAANIDSALDGEHIEGKMLQVGESIEITATVADRSKPLHLLLYSRYRDWTGGIMGDLEQKSFSEAVRIRWQKAINARKLNKSFVKGYASMFGILAAIAVLAVAFPFYSGNRQNVSTGNTGAMFAIPHALADYPHSGRSLVIEYRKNGKYIKTGLIQPRYYRAAPHTVSIPKEAIDENGETRIRISATKRHEVVAATLIAADAEEVAYKAVMASRRITLQRDGKDYREILSRKHSGNYLRLRPTDVVDLEFDATGMEKVQKDGMNISCLLSIGGFYIPLTSETRRKLGKNWIGKLQPEDREVLKGLYSLGEYPVRV